MSKENLEESQEKNKENIETTEEVNTLTTEEIEEQPVKEESEQAENTELNSNPLEQALAEAESRIEELKDRLLRSQADFDNYRKRVQKEKEEMTRYAARSLLEKLLPAVDNLERAIQSSKQSENFAAFAQGVEMVYRQIMDALEQEGAVPIDAVGKPFDPYYHQAVMQVEAEGEEAGIVVEEFQKGYMLKDKVIRPSMVKVTT